MDFSQGSSLVRGGMALADKFTKGIVQGLATQTVAQRIGATIQTRLQQVTGESGNTEEPFNESDKIKAMNHTAQQELQLRYIPKGDEFGTVRATVVGAFVFAVFSDGTIMIRPLSPQGGQSVNINVLD